MVVENAKRKANRYDIVYFVKESVTNEELRYSMRSLINFPHNRVWIYGYCPPYLKPDRYVRVYQNEPTKWGNVNKMLRMVSQNDNISEQFWLFNDDFFIMEKVKHPINYYHGNLYKRIVDIENKYGKITPYSKLLRECCTELESLGCPTKDYALHIPMLMERTKLREMFRISSVKGFRSIYGNLFNAGDAEMRDVKIIGNIKTYQSGIYLSTDDKSFNGAVGKQIRERFTNKSIYEK